MPADYNATLAASRQLGAALATCADRSRELTVALTNVITLQNQLRDAVARAMMLLAPADRLPVLAQLVAPLKPSFNHVNAAIEQFLSLAVAYGDYITLDETKQSIQ